MIYSSMALNLDQDLMRAALPLMVEGKLEAIEWSFDTLYKNPHLPAWFSDLLSEFGGNGRLMGHGVYFSLFSGKWTFEQQQWLDKLKYLSKNFKFDHISEHFGFMTGEDFHKGAPLNIPLHSQTLRLGTDRLKRIQDACGCPVGVENLAFCYSLVDVVNQGEFLSNLLETVNGFLILDLHNIHCQLLNFDLTLEDLLYNYPLERVREIHISGGSWFSPSSDPLKWIRRDTHDDRVPSEIWNYLQKAIPLCPNLKFVVLEQIGSSLHSEESLLEFQHDFNRMDSIIKTYLPPPPSNSFLPEKMEAFALPHEDLFLHLQQTELAKILEKATSLDEAKIWLSQSSLSKTEWKIEIWDDAMLETAMDIAKKWKDGFKDYSNSWV